MEELAVLATWYQWIGLVALLFSMVVSFVHLLRLIRAGRPVDYSRPEGSIPEGIRYSFTTAMNPAKKESAFLHLPTYFSGIMYHLGVFFTLLLFVVMIFRGTTAGLPLSYWLAVVPIVGGGAGAWLLIKRLADPMMRRLSTPDDYISNLLVTLFQLTAVLSLLTEGNTMLFLLSGGMLLLYFPLGKLKHAIYFFAARYYLGVFYGSRAVWSKPSKP